MTPGLLFVATAPIVANRPTGGQLHGHGGLHRIRRILEPGYTLEHAVADPQCPVAPQVCTPLPRHWVVPGLQTPAQAPTHA